VLSTNAFSIAFSIVVLLHKEPLPLRVKKAVHHALSRAHAERVLNVRKLIAALGVPIVIGFMNMPRIRAQSQSSSQFEVASVRGCRADAAPGRGSRKGSGGSSPGRLNLPCQTVMSLIQWAYVNFANAHFNPLGSVPISGGPAWINSDHYEINAKAEGAQSWGVMNGPMLRVLLEDRFKLKIHRETREVPVYALTVAKGGPKLQSSKEGSCAPFDVDHPPPTPEPGKPFPRLCGTSRVTNNGFDAPGVTMENFSRLLSGYSDRSVVDKTGIVGVFDIHLGLSAADLGHSPPALSDSPGPATPPDPADIFSTVRMAIQKLGLKLESAKGRGEFLVIDRVERPSEN
jgi:uncharacterized protein (TIGR03435 family)